MTKVRLIVVTIALACFSSTSANAAITFVHAPSIYQRWISHLALPLPKGNIVVYIGTCPSAPNAEGCSVPGTTWLAPSAGRAVLLHELGHQFDYTQPIWARAAFEGINHDQRPWTSEPNGPFEQFAEAWAGCAAPNLATSRYDTATSRYEFAFGYSPTVVEFRETCRLILAETGRRVGL